MAFEYPEDLKYLDTHEYVRLDDDIATLGITEYAIAQLGDIVFLELKEIGDTLSKDEKFGTIESVKAVEDLNAPVSGTIVEINELLINFPEQIANDPYGDGWLVKVRVNDVNEIYDCMTADEYSALVEGK